MSGWLRHDRIFIERYRDIVGFILFQQAIYVLRWDV